MQILPAIDLKGGKVVRLLRGDFSKETVYEENPAAVAKRWESEGAKWIHVVDLDGAFQGEPKNLKWVKEIAQSVSCSIECGGGIRTPETIEELLSYGVKRAVLGTRAILSETFLRDCIRDFGSHIAVSIDARENKLTTHGWTETVSMDAPTMAKRLEEMGLAIVICTDVGKDGTLEGPNLSLYERLVQSTSIPYIVSGGISSLNDIATVLKLKGRRPWGVIVGRAFYEKRFSLSEAMALC
ncbi:MAG: 1-(5-phosphoribosyl)-5-[(5-phosphoribosylamino)methylideneamino]imidazole-4-carboxamide isomerase [Candidatus Omnitrophica bacterium]|nr:1-(5-phosphoribosyl)-5-[(5-phosphoribosylamino)methylideneamino]imidazole-4-carboxamide isomerase [Candidatus Omnitrophota bacterium]